VLGGSLREDVDFEVGLCHVLRVRILVLLAESVALTLVLLELLRQVGLLLFQASLDDLSPRQQTLLQTSQGLVLDSNGRFLFQRVPIVG